MHEFGPGQNMRSILVLSKCGSEEEAKHWVETVLLFSSLEVRGTEEEGIFAFFQYIKRSPPRENVDKEMGCVSLRGALTTTKIVH